MDVGAPEIHNPSAVARERVKLGPIPDWVVPCTYEGEFKSNPGGPLTYLLIERQIQAELRQTYFRMSVRLETMQAVQHESQWRLAFEPQSQSVILHSIAVRRGATKRDHVSLEKLQFLQREAGLEGFVLDGWITLLLLLEDVAPGDILEYAYTVTTRPRLLPEHVDSLFTLPLGVEIGKYHFSVLHSSTRALRWKSSGPEFTPGIENAEPLVRCFWMGEKVSSPGPEEYTPEWYLAFPWMQVSDCPDWQTVSCGVHNVWKEEVNGEGLAKLVEEIKGSGLDLPGQVSRAIELLQDSFRYLSVNVELGGQVPAPAETVIRRRYGDCKDLAFLLVLILRALGVQARPVLVNVHWGKAVGSMLPSPNIFNHAVVEFELGAERRWVDATIKSQGGGALRRAVSNCGLGLPIGSSCEGLAETPRASVPNGEFSVHESFILDTWGQPSYYAVVTTARGIHADHFRLKLANEGVESIARERLQTCANRFTKAARIGALQFRDEREQNEFVFAEAFEVEGFFRQDTDRDACLFIIQSDLVGGSLYCPSSVSRRTPFAPPFPCNYTHTVEVDFNGLETISIPVVQTGDEFLQFARRSKSLPKYLRVTFTLDTKIACVPAEKVTEYRQRIQEIWRECTLQIRLPLGYGRTRRRSDFGALPPLTRPRDRMPVTEGASRVEPPPVPKVLPASAQQPHAQAEQPPGPAERRVFAGPKLVPVMLPTETVEGNASHNRRYRGSKRGLHALLLSLLTLGGFGLTLALAGAHAYGLAGWLSLVIIPTLLWSLVLAVLALLEARKHKGYHFPGQGHATAALIIGMVLAWFYTPRFISGFNYAMKSAAERRQLRAKIDEQIGLLKFPELNFEFRSLSPPWTQVNPRTFGYGPVLAFMRPDQVSFKMVAERIGPDVTDPDKRQIERCRALIQMEAVDFQFLGQKQVTRNGIAGWEIDGEGRFQGHEYYVIHWLVATNGYGYALVVWGPTPLKQEIKSESEQVFPNFLPKPPQPARGN